MARLDRGHLGMKNPVPVVLACPGVCLSLRRSDTASCPSCPGCPGLEAQFLLTVFYALPACVSTVYYLLLGLLGLLGQDKEYKALSSVLVASRSRTDPDSQRTSVFAGFVAECHFGENFRRCCEMTPLAHAMGLPSSAASHGAGTVRLPLSAAFALLCSGPVRIVKNRVVGLHPPLHPPAGIAE
jgi:hypothetical protein